MSRRPSIPALVLASCAPLIALPCLADDRPSEPKTHALHSRSWAMEFQINRTDVIGPFRGATIALKKQRSDHAAWRLGLTLDFFAGTTDESDAASDTSFAASRTRNSHSDRQSIGVSFLRISYPAPEAAVKPYWGVGPSFRYARSAGHESDVNLGARYDPRPLRFTSRGHGWGAGIAGVAGAQWFATPSISFLAEYGIAAEYSSSITAQHSTVGGYRRDADYRSSGFSLNSTGVALGLSAYF